VPSRFIPQRAGRSERGSASSSLHRGLPCHIRRSRVTSNHINEHPDSQAGHLRLKSPPLGPSRRRATRQIRPGARILNSCIGRGLGFKTSSRVPHWRSATSASSTALEGLSAEVRHDRIVRGHGQKEDLSCPLRELVDHPMYRLSTLFPQPWPNNPRRRRQDHQYKHWQHRDRYNKDAASS
jgi:hypothetical protein